MLCQKGLEQADCIALKTGSSAMILSMLQYSKTDQVTAPRCICLAALAAMPMIAMRCPLQQPCVMTATHFWVVVMEQ